MEEEKIVPNIALMLNLNEINFILEKLSKYPYDEVVPVIDKIRLQSIQQLKSQQETE